MSKLKDGVYQIGIIIGNKRLAKGLLKWFSELLSFSYFNGRKIIEKEELLYKGHPSKVIYTEEAEDFFKIRHLIERTKLPEQNIVLFLNTEKPTTCIKDIREHAFTLHLDLSISRSEILSSKIFSEESFERFLTKKGLIGRGETHVE